MNIKNLEQQFGITLHDALLREWSVNLAESTATFVVDVCVGDPSARSDVEQERYRTAALRLCGLAYLAVDPPDARYVAARSAPVRIDVCDPDPEFIRRYPASDDAFAARLFVEEWNAFIHLAAKDARFEWLEAG